MDRIASFHSYLQIEIFLVRIEYRPLRDVITEGGPLLVLNECFAILVKRGIRGEITLSLSLYGPLLGMDCCTFARRARCN